MNEISVSPLRGRRRGAVRRRRAGAMPALVLVMLLTGCGPKGLFEVSVHTFPADISLGGHKEPTVAQPAVVGANLEPLAAPGFIQPPLPPILLARAMPSPLPAPPCPDARPDTPLQAAATADSAAPPAAGLYEYRNAGNFTEGSAKATFASMVTRLVTNILHPTPASPGNPQGIVTAPRGRSTSSRRALATRGPAAPPRPMPTTRSGRPMRPTPSSAASPSRRSRRSILMGPRIHSRPPPRLNSCATPPSLVSPGVPAAPTP